MEGPRAEELSRGDPERPRRRWPLLVLGAVVLAGLGAREVDDRWRADEYAALQRTCGDVRTSLSYADAQVASVVAYASPLLQSGPADVRAGLLGLVGDAARAQLPDLRSAELAVRAVGVRPWHGALREAQAACERSAVAAVALYTAGADDPQALRRPRQRLDEALTRAQEALAAARTPVPDGDGAASG